MTDNIDDSGNAADDMSEYLQTYLDETEEQLDDLVETVLALEQDVTSTEDLNEAFRLIHSIKGSAGMMGFDSITMLTHHLEDRFEQFRSGRERLDDSTMSLVLRCIDFLRQCNQRLREGEQLGSSTELLDELRQLETTPPENTLPENTPAGSEARDVEDDEQDAAAQQGLEQNELGDAARLIVVRFRPGLQLIDLKAKLIVTRLAGLGKVVSTRPELDRLQEVAQLEVLEIRIDSDHDAETLAAAVNVEGVDSVECPTIADDAPTQAISSDGNASEAPTSDREPAEKATRQAVEDEEPPSSESDVDAAIPDADDGEGVAAEESELAVAVASQPWPTPEPKAEIAQRSSEAPEPPPAGFESPEPAALGEPAPTEVHDGAEPRPTEKTGKVAETMRVDIDRLDNLMNLAGELVVNRARFVQLSDDLSPSLRKSSELNRIRGFRDGLRRAIESMESDARGGNWAAEIHQLREGLELIDEQAEVWNNGRRCLGQISEAVDQLSRVSSSLQRGVLDTRMVPVGPLFSRFKRVVRDLSKQRGKQVNLVIQGENTELDKRMIDELGEPLVHLVRNSIDHGLESPAVRERRGKPSVGSIHLNASHRGNSVLIAIHDDGGGIDVSRIRAKLVDRAILTPAAVDELSDAQALAYIWHPGFSTANEVTDVSGRGVGMDVVKNRISQLNGSIDVDTSPEVGATFTIRLPLTLAIIHSLLVRMRNVVFSIPMEDIREIVSVQVDEVLTVQGNQTIDVRDEYVPLVGVKDVFQWHGVDYGHEASESAGKGGEAGETKRTAEVVILRSRGKTIGLRVEGLLGSQDIVVKSLSDNFTSIPGLSGASILGDGSVSFMLDVGAVIDQASGAARSAVKQGTLT